MADLEHKDHGGHGSAAVLDELRRAMATAVRLRERLEFVVAPVPTVDGGPVVALDDRYVMSVFPFAHGEPGSFGQEQSREERERVLDLLAELHGHPAPPSTPFAALDPPGRAMLEDIVDGRVGEWKGGPFAAAYRLVDWDTVGLAVPERDLSVVSTDPTLLDRYARATGSTPDPDALALYPMRWLLTDVAEFAGWFRGPHSRTADTERAWQGFTETVERLGRHPR
ncbi:phosphotransferase [Amycolatopsis cihanbeyliensis]|uniref:phosphotransferase n=1 Tax=Amycolatopsis cihanbeyliensis TaxID=1128664 RepID=UPI001FE77760|nr:phosphotransferase [Amycolatopsis cihanbeyliensis]